MGVADSEASDEVGEDDAGSSSEELGTTTDERIFPSIGNGLVDGRAQVFFVAGSHGPPGTTANIFVVIDGGTVVTPSLGSPNGEEISGGGEQTFVAQDFAAGTYTFGVIYDETGVGQINASAAGLRDETVELVADHTYLAFTTRYEPGNGDPYGVALSLTDLSALDAQQETEISLVHTTLDDTASDANRRVSLSLEAVRSGGTDVLSTSAAAGDLLTFDREGLQSLSVEGSNALAMPFSYGFDLSVLGSANLIVLRDDVSASDSEAFSIGLSLYEYSAIGDTLRVGEARSPL